MSNLDTARTIGPVEVLAVEFPGNNFTGEILPALADLIESGTVRLIDLVFVTKDADGNVAAIEVSGLPPEAAAMLEKVSGHATDVPQRGGHRERRRDARPEHLGRPPGLRRTPGRRASWRRSGTPTASS